MSNGSGPGLSGYPDIQPPRQRVTQAWNRVIELLYRRLPAGVHRSQQARTRMLSRKR